MNPYRVTIGEYSAYSNTSRIQRTATKMHLQGLNKKRKRIDGSHLSQASDRSSQIRQTLISQIESMNDQEVEIMQKEFNKISYDARKQQKESEKPKVGYVSLVQLNCMLQSKYLDRLTLDEQDLDTPKIEVEDQTKESVQQLEPDMGKIDEISEKEEMTQHDDETGEALDTVEPLQDPKAAVPEIAHSNKSSLRSFKSSRSSQYEVISKGKLERQRVYIQQLESEIAKERTEREKLQKEMEEVKKLSTQLLSQLNSRKNSEQASP